MKQNVVPFAIENGTFAKAFAKDQRPALEVQNNFSFVLNISRLEDSSSEKNLIIFPGHELRRATEAEIAAIRDVLHVEMSIDDWSPWQAGSEITNEDGSTSRISLPPDQWRYFVISFSGSNETVSGIERALTVAPVELKIGFTLLGTIFPNKKIPMLIYHTGRLFSQLESIRRHDPSSFFEVTATLAKDIGSLHDQMKSYDHKLINLARLVEQLLELDALPSQSPLIFLGYFAILESLLTHQPKPTDTIDSITRQVKRKVILLDNRWQPRVDYSQLPNKAPEKIWSAMYSYRSCLAHGSEPDFNKELQLLKDSYSALRLLRQTVKSVVRYALVEPQLIADLRDC